LYSNDAARFAVTTYGDGLNLTMHQSIRLMGYIGPVTLTLVHSSVSLIIL